MGYREPIASLNTPQLAHPPANRYGQFDVHVTELERSGGDWPDSDTIVGKEGTLKPPQTTPMAVMLE